MQARIPRALVAGLVIVCASAPSRVGAWSSDPGVDHIVVDAANLQTAASVVADGNGGAFVAWRDQRAGGGMHKVYVQHIAPDGSMGWADDGVLAGWDAEVQGEPAAALDGAGGVFVVWHDGRGDGTDIYGQRLDVNGNRLWEPNGHAICEATRDQTSPRIVSDGAGGAFLAWTDRRRFNQEDIFGQHILADGSNAWAVGGVEIQVDAGAERYVELVADGVGGMVAITGDLSGDLIRARRFNADGSTRWGAVRISSGPQNFPEIHAVPDGTGGAFVIWSSTTSDLWGQHVDGTGALRWNGGFDQAITTVAGSKADPRLAFDGDDGAYVAFTDWRSGTGDVYTQHLDAAGTRLWGDAAIFVDAAATNTPRPNVTEDGSGHAIVTWLARENGHHEIQAQRFRPDGVAEWAADGLDVSVSDSHVNYLVEIVPSVWGAIMVFEAEHSPSGRDLYAKRINGDGTLGDLLAVGDAGAPAPRVWAAPNPFRTDVAISFEEELAGLRVDIVDAAGRCIRTLHAAGGSMLRWDGSDARGVPAQPGVYFVRIDNSRAPAARLVRLP